MKIGRRSGFSDKDQIAIKERIWNGEIQRVVAESVGLAEKTIHGIVGGHIWADVPWPDGLTGPLSNARRREISRARYKNSGNMNRHYKVAARMAKEDEETEIDWITEEAFLKLQGNLNPTPAQVRESLAKRKGGGYDDVK